MTEIELIAWLTGPDGRRWLAQAPPKIDPLTSLTRLRKQLDADQAQALVEQWTLRVAARQKFPFADQMYLTRKGLEQSTDYWLAAYKAQRFPPNQPLADLCCGIGGDFQALAQVSSSCVGYDLDPSCAQWALENATAAQHYHTAQGASSGHTQVTTRQQDVFTADLSPFAAWHLDPDRRSQGSRTTHLEIFSPSLEAIETMLGDNPNAALKLAPATETPSEWNSIAEREWISRAGECRQQVVWLGSLSQAPGNHRATVLTKTGQVAFTLTGQPRSHVPVASTVGLYLHEPDAAVLAANLAHTLAADQGWQAVGTDVMYFTSPEPTCSAGWSTFAVRDILPFDAKQLVRYARDQKWGQVEIKKRRVDLDPAAWQRKLSSKSGLARTLLICPCAERVTVFVTERVS